MEGQQTTLAEALNEAQRLIRMGNIRAAAGLTTQLYDQAPDHPPIQAIHGIACSRLGHYNRAAPLLESAIEAGPEGPMLVRLTNELAQVRINQGRLNDALEALDRGLEVEPDAGFLLGTKAEALLYAGRRDEAEKLIKDATARGVEHISLAMALGRLRRHHGDPADAIEALTPYVEMEGMTGAQRAQALGRLGDLLDRAGKYDDAWACYRRAANFAWTEYDPAAHARVVDAIIANWTPQAMNKLKRPEGTSTAPVFIVGMPRSGTSLVEQILACHPDVFACGELDTLAFIAKKALGAESTLFRPTIERPITIKGKQLEVAAKLYENKLRIEMERDAEDRGLPAPKTLAKRITDKQPLNFYYLGAAALMFPEAHFIHCVRDPRDTCLSCYFSQFATAHPYANDLETLGAFCRDERRLMDHWKKTLPEIGARVTEVRYEDMVADQDAQTRKLLDFLGLDFNDACLRYHESDRVTRTLSNDQVRQPIYASSVGRYKNYASHIKALTDALADALQSEN
ncbi:MAG: sulfotransferase [Phycisphaerales bacterium JB059]